MKITFLGTSHGLPAENRYCSSLLLEVGERAYLIDGGAPVGDILIKKGFDFAKIKAIFTSHAHSDHTFGMLQFISLCNWHYKAVSMDVFFTEESIAEAVKNLLLASDKKFEENRLHSKIIYEGEIFNDGTLKVTAIPTMHMLPHPSFALVFEANGKRFIYTGDLHGKDALDFPQIASNQPSDLIVTESAHFKVETILEKVLSCPTKNAAIIHIFGDMEHILKTIEQADGHTNIKLFAPNDGDIIEL